MAQDFHNIFLGQFLVKIKILTNNSENKILIDYFHIYATSQ